MFSREADVTREGADIESSTDTAMPLVLILNELLINAVKHGSDARGISTARVELARQNDLLVLCMGDGGPGFDLQAVHRRSSGLQLVQGIVRQLRGKFDVERNPSRCIIQFW
jgi:two-component sensor histidine kinase